MITENEVVDLLKTVVDPDIFIDIYTLGLIYKIEIHGSEVDVTMTFTTVACPSGPMLIEEVRSVLLEHPEVEGVNVDVVFEPPWEPSDELKEMMGIY